MKAALRYIAVLAQGTLDLLQGIKGEITAQECENSLLKLGLVYGVGYLGDALGGPVAGLMLSFAGGKLLDEVDKLNKESYRLINENGTPPGI